MPDERVRFVNYKKFYKKIRSSKVALYLSPFIIYLLVAYFLWGPEHLSYIHTYIFRPSGDQELFTWALKWWPFSIAHGINPFIEKYLFNPSGYNLAWSTSVPTLALLMAPVTVIWGALTSFNILALIAIPVSALSCFCLVFYLSKKYWASVLCGFIYGFSSFQLVHLQGHPCFYANFVPPLVVLTIMLRFNNRLRKIPFILVLGLLMVMQFGISTEAFAAMMIIGSLTWLLVLIFANKKLRPVLLKISRELVWAIIVALLILSPYIYYVLTGFGSVPKFIYPPVGYSTDLLNFIVPTKVTLIGGKTYLYISSKFTANIAEQGAYLTIPLVLFMVTFSLYYWRKWYVKVLGVLAVLTALLSLGPRLNVGGMRTSFPLPETFFTRLPFLRSILPMRFVAYLPLIAAVMLGLWFSYSQKNLNKKKLSIVPLFKYLLVMVVLVLMIPDASNYPWQKNNVPKLFAPEVATQYIGKNQNVLFLPYVVGYDPDFWQQYSGMAFTTVNGYLGFPPISATNDTTAYNLYHDIPEANFTKNFIVFCKTRHVTEIIYAPYALTQGPVEVQEVQSLNWPSYKFDEFVIVKVPKAYQ